MAWLLVTLFLAVANLAWLAADAAIDGRASQALYDLFGSIVPAGSLRLAIVGAVDGVLLLILMRFVDVETYLGRRDRSHPLYCLFRWRETYLGNRGEWWPARLLSLLTVVHAMSAYGVVRDVLDARLWWAGALLLVALWANARVEPLTVAAGSAGEAPQRNPATGGSPASPDAQEPAAERPALFDVLADQRWFRGQIVHRASRGSAGEGTPLVAGYPAAACPSDRAPLLDAHTVLRDAAQHMLGGQSAGGDVALWAHQSALLGILAPDQGAAGPPRHACLATPVGSGRSTASLLAALHAVLVTHRNVLLLYADPEAGRLLAGKLVRALQESDWEWAVAVACAWSDQEHPQWVSAGLSPVEGEGAPPVDCPDLLLTDLAALDAQLLPAGDAWRPFLGRLGLLIVEDMDCYTGVRGGHASAIVRRLLRLAEGLGSAPQILATARPVSGLESLFERFFALGPQEFSPAHVVSEDGCGSAQKELLVWNPEFDAAPDPAAPHRQGLGERRRTSYLEQVRAIVGAAVAANYSPQMVYATDAMCAADFAEEWNAWRANAQRLGHSVEIPYGESTELAYGASARLQLDSPLNHDVAVVLGLPPDLAALRHQLAHLGDGAETPGAHIVAVLPDVPLPQYLGRTMAEGAGLPPRGETVLPLSNDALLAHHVYRSLCERPGGADSILRWFGRGGVMAYRALLAEGRLAERDWLSPGEDGAQPSTTRQASGIVGRDGRLALDCVGPADWALDIGGRVVRYLSADDVGRRIYPGAVLIAGEERFRVVRMDHDHRRAEAESVSDPLRTERLLEATLHPNDPEATLTSGSLAAGGTALQRYGPSWCEVTETMHGYRVVDMVTYESSVTRYATLLERGPLRTRAFFWGLPQATPEGAHAIAHALRAILPVFLGETAASAEFAILVDHEAVPGVGLAVYDGVLGGSGAADWLGQAEHLHEALALALDLLETCACAAGCPACTGVVDCHLAPTGGADTCTLDKQGAIATLRALCAAPSAALDPVDDLTARLQAYRREMVEEVFPTMLGVTIRQPASVTITDGGGLAADVAGIYRPADNEIVLREAPLPDMLACLAHELAHNWQHQDTGGMAPALLQPTRVTQYGGKLFVEGLACWVEDKVCDRYGLRRTWAEPGHRAWSAYSEGYRLLRWLEERGGTHAVMRFAREAQVTLDGETLDEVALLERSSLFSVVMEKEARFTAQPPPSDVG